MLYLHCKGVIAPAGKLYKKKQKQLYMGLLGERAVAY